MAGNGLHLGEMLGNLATLNETASDTSVTMLHLNHNIPGMSRTLKPLATSRGSQKNTSPLNSGLCFSMLHKALVYSAPPRLLHKEINNKIMHTQQHAELS